jgi:hypothetical protein
LIETIGLWIASAKVKTAERKYPAISLNNPLQFRKDILNICHLH